MATNFHQINESAVAGKKFKDTLRQLQQAWNGYCDIRANLIQAKDADTGQDTDYATIAVYYVYAGSDLAAQEANAHGSFSEIDACFGACDAAMRQMLARHLP